MVSVNVAELKKIVDLIELKLVGKAPQLKAFSVMTGVPAVYLIAGVGFLFFSLLWLLSGFRAIVHLVAYIYPGWQSLKALNSESREDDTLWLAYWVIYGFITMFESITDLLLHRIPFYELVKLGFYVYLYEARGALTVYESVLRPFVVKIQSFRVHSKVEEVEVPRQQLEQQQFQQQQLQQQQLQQQQLQQQQLQPQVDRSKIAAQGSINVQSYGNQAPYTNPNVGMATTSRNTNTRKID